MSCAPLACGYGSESNDPPNLSIKVLALPLLANPPQWFATYLSVSVQTCVWGSTTAFFFAFLLSGWKSTSHYGFFFPRPGPYKRVYNLCGEHCSYSFLSPKNCGRLVRIIVSRRDGSASIPRACKLEKAFYFSQMCQCVPVSMQRGRHAQNQETGWSLLRAFHA